MARSPLFSSLHRAGPLLLLGVGLLLAAAPAHAQRVALGARASTLGLGGDLTVGLSRTVNVRVGGSYYPVERSGVYPAEVDVRYTVNAHLAAGQLILDWHPFANAFRLSAGAVYNGTRVRGHAEPTERYRVQGKTFGPERLGRLDGEASFRNKINPYLGVGFGNAVRGSRVDVFVDLGAMYVAQPEVQMTGEGLISATANHAASLNEGLRSFRLLPYMSLGLSTDL